MKLIFFILLQSCFILTAISQLNYASTLEDLSCNFSSNFCTWSSIALPPENPNRWRLATNIISPTSLDHTITSASNQEAFAIAQFKKRSGSASLISYGILCQNTPFQLRFQTCVTDDEAKLFICHRTLTTKRTRFTRCQEIKNLRHNEWETHTVSQVYDDEPYQLVFRAFGSNKNSSVALKDIKVISGSLCKNRTTRNAPSSESADNQIKVITYEDWQKIKKDNEPVPQVRPRILLVVSEQVEASTEVDTTTTKPMTVPAETTTNEASSTSTPGITKCTDDFCVEKESSEETSTEQSESKDEVTETIADNKKLAAKSPQLDPQNLPSLGQWVQLLKNVAPIIPIIPSLINSLKYGETPPMSSTATFTPDSALRTEEKVFSWKPGDTRRAPTPIMPLSISHHPTSNKNTFGISTGALSEVSTSNPSAATGAKQNLNLSTLTVNELKTLESIHKKIFPIEPTTSAPSTFQPRRGESRRKVESRFANGRKSLRFRTPISTTTTTVAPVVVFEKPKQQISDIRTSVAGNLKYLTPQMIEELNMVSSLPDLEVLTEGLDLSLLNKPGGFAVLKQQFMERLIKRLPFKDTDVDLLQATRYR